MALAAELWATESAERRGGVRRYLQLQTASQTSAGKLYAIIRNLSENGLLLETAADLPLGEQLNVTLPGAGMRPAIVLWSRPPFFGCEFSSPITKGMISEALLRAAPETLRTNVDYRSWTPVALNTDRSGATKFERGTLRVLAISLVLLLWVLMAFINIVLPVPIP